MILKEKLTFIALFDGLKISLNLFTSNGVSIATSAFIPCNL